MQRLRSLVPIGLCLVVAASPLACGDKGSSAQTTSTKVENKKSSKKADKGNKGRATDTAQAGAYSWDLPKGISKPPTVPDDNPMTWAKIELGHKLFMDPDLSADGSRSCYTCHQNELGNADGRAKALGAKDKPLTRNSPTIWNVAFHGALYWDGRAPSLEKQAIGAWKGGNMGVGADNLEAKAAQTGKRPEYAKAFQSAFGLKEGEAVTPAHVAQAISSYERTLLCGDTVYDKQELGEAASRGQALFTGKAGCVACHVGEIFSDGLFHNIGLEADASGKFKADADIGHGKVAKDAAKNHTFRTPTLRNVAKTAPYFHNGSVASLEEAVRYMAGGGNPNAPGIDPLLRDTKLGDAEVKDLVAFLESLDCPGALEVVGEQPTLATGG